MQTEVGTKEIPKVSRVRTERETEGIPKVLTVGKEVGTKGFPKVSKVSKAKEGEGIPSTSRDVLEKEVKVDNKEKRREPVAQKMISRAIEEVLREVEEELGKTKKMERDEEREILVVSKWDSICLEEFNVDVRPPRPIFIVHGR